MNFFNPKLPRDSCHRLRTCWRLFTLKMKPTKLQQIATHRSLTQLSSFVSKNSQENPATDSKNKFKKKIVYQENVNGMVRSLREAIHVVDTTIVGRKRALYYFSLWLSRSSGFLCLLLVESRFHEDLGALSGRFTSWYLRIGRFKSVLSDAAWSWRMVPKQTN